MLLNKKLTLLVILFPLALNLSAIAAAGSEQNTPDLTPPPAAKAVAGNAQPDEKKKADAA